MILLFAGRAGASEPEVPPPPPREGGFVAPVLAAAGGWDFRADDLWSGAELSLQADNVRSIAPIGRLGGGWALLESKPRIEGEIGALVVVPEMSEAAVARVGLVVEGVWTRAEHVLPFDRVPDEEGQYSGVIPAVMGHVEFEYGRDVTYALGARFGVGSELSTAGCDLVLLHDCLGWRVGFAGGFVGRLRVPHGVAIEATLGPSLSLAVGWAP